MHVHKRTVPCVMTEECLPSHPQLAFRSCKVRSEVFCAGEVLHADSPGYTVPLSGQHQSRAAQIAQADLELELNVDPTTAKRIRELHRQKQEAVQSEEYDEAQRLKEAIERIKQLGVKIAQLEACKAVRLTP